MMGREQVNRLSSRSEGSYNIQYTGNVEIKAGYLKFVIALKIRGCSPRPR